MSTSQDGKILLWNPLPSKNNLKLSDAYFVATKFGGGKASGKAMGGNNGLVFSSFISHASLFRLVNYVAFNNEDTETFVLGCDSGLIYKGSLNSAASVESREEGLADMSVPPKNPITMEYQSHDSPIYSASFSPFHRHLFLTSGHDGQMRIYSQLFVRTILSSCDQWKVSLF